MWENEVTALQKRLSRAIQQGITEEDTRLLMEHLSFVLQENRSINLTRIEDVERALVLHIEDSLVALQEIQSLPQGSMIDLGSGGGFPGIPLAIITKRKTTLVEATKKKAALLEAFITKNGLQEYIEVAALRIEELARSQRERYTIATARALSSLPSLIELAAPLLQIGGVLIAYKARVCQEELDTAIRLEAVVGMEFIEKRNLTLSDEVTEREIILFKKTGQPTKALPRRNGQAQAHPLKPQ